MFVHLNTHSIYSPMRGLLSLPKLIDKAKSHSMDTLGLTDVNGLWGFIRFVQHAREADIKPIAGVNLITVHDEVILLVENQNGYENLCRIVSVIHDNPDQRVYDVLEGYSFGLFVIAFEKHTLQLLHRFIPDTHLFIELRPGFSELQIQQLSRELKLEIIVTGDVYFASEEDYTSHIVLRAIEKNVTLDQIDLSQQKTKKHWFRGEQDMVRLFPNSLGAINNSRYLADRCKTDWSFINTIFPGLSLKDTYHANRKLKDKVYIGAKKRYGHVNVNVQDRIDYELGLITQKGFAPYFLIVQDIVTKTQSTIGRGSAAASIVSYCLFITQVDPLRYDLQFERFIHAERENMPDIDIDFPWDERDNILQYIFKKYGNKRTAMVSNQVLLKPRSAIREVAKVYGLSNEEINSITNRIGWYHSSKDLQNWIRTDPRFAKLDVNDTIIRILKESEKIIGVFRYSSVHPGGVLIVPDEIRKYVPVLTAPKGVQIVEWEKDQVEDSGLLKIDLLGNRSLAVVRDTIRSINIRKSEINHKYLDYHKIQPIGDKKTENLLKAGKTMGVFYIESPATRQLLAKSRVVDFEHVVIYSSIIRPAANRYTNLMLSRIHGEKWDLIHPDLKFLNESYGIMVYEEHVSMAVMIMAGLGYAEAEQLRKTMSRNSMEHLIISWKKRFVQGAKQRGYPLRIIDEIWNMIESFVGYSFCKPHSASYAMLSFTCAYLKAHFPAEFLSSVISNQGGFYSTYAYMNEARRFKIKILTPDINESNYQWHGQRDEIRMGFMSIRRLKEKSIRLILSERRGGKFDSLDDFLFRVDLDLSDAMALTNAGCFKSISIDDSHQEIAYKVAGFYLQDTSRKSFEPKLLKKYLTLDEKYQLELDTFGFPIIVHPAARYRSMLSDRIRYAKDIPEYFGRSIYLIGVYITRKESITKTSDPMEFLTLEDETDIYECILFPSVFKEFGDLLHWEKLFIVKGKVEVSFGVYNINIEKIASLQQWLNRIKKNKSLFKYNFD